MTEQVATTTIVEEMRKLRQGEVSIEEMEAIRQSILTDDKLRLLLTEKQTYRLARARGRSQLFYNLMSFWGRQLAKSPEAIGLGSEVIRALKSSDTSAVIWGYYQVTGLLEAESPVRVGAS